MTLVQPNLGPSIHIERKEKKEMLSVVKTAEGKTRVRINSSSLLTIQECLRKTKYSLLEEWRAESESPSTLFGSAIHSALESFYLLRPEERVLPSLSEMELISFGNRLSPEREASPLIKATRKFLERGTELNPLPTSDKRSLQNGVWLLHSYFKQFASSPYIAHTDEFGPFLERSFTLPFFSDEKLEIELFGTIDFVFRNLNSGSLIPGDHKTSSTLSFGDSSYFDREKPNHQYTIYSLAANRLFGIKTEDFLVSIFEVKKRPTTTRGSEPSFPQQITKRTEEDYEEVSEVIHDSVERLLWAMERDKFPLGSVDACAKYGGCSFRQVCASPSTMRETILNGKFTKGWSL